jgi:hypothetical protein
MQVTYAYGRKFFLKKHFASLFKKWYPMVY